MPLYEVLIENESNRFKEIVAISYFRRFFIVKETEKGQLALAQLLEHLAYMPLDIEKKPLCG